MPTDLAQKYGQDRLPAGLKDHQSWMTTVKPSKATESIHEADLADLLLEEDQAHLFSQWKEGAQDVDKKHKFFEGVAALETGYPGGIRAYLKKARELLGDAASGANPFSGYTPKVPEGEKMDYADSKFLEMEGVGIKAFKDCALVLVAGGLGERLGYNGIKVSLPVEITTETKFLELYVKTILALQDRSNELCGTNRKVPLAVMTSDDTHTLTEKLLKDNNYFGASPDQIRLVKQEKVAALIDNEAHIAVDEKDPYNLVTKPHGHGDVHTLLHSSGIAEEWVSEGRKHVIFFQDTNSLAFTVTTAALGVSETRQFEVNSIAVPRKAKEAVGAITKLDKDDGSSLTCNVEYNQLEPLLKASGFERGDVNDETGYSPYPGNINQLIFALEPYVNVLKRTKGLVPEFVNPKYADESKTKFKKPTRLECMMQDHPRVLGPEAKVGFTQFPDWTYTAVKNSIEDAKKKYADGVPMRAASDGERDYYNLGARLLRMVGAQVEENKPLHVHGVEVDFPPRIVFDPTFAPTFHDFQKKVPVPSKINVTQRSTLIVRGVDITIESLDLDGTLVIEASPGAKVTVRNARVRNDGWELTPLKEGEDVPEYLSIRGFKLSKHGEKILRFSEAGDHVVEGELQ